MPAIPAEAAPPILAGTADLPVFLSELMPQKSPHLSDCMLVG
jgi:hypothetical protein